MSNSRKSVVTEPTKDESAAEPQELTATTPVVDPVQPEPNPADLPVEGQEIPTIYAVDFDNLPTNTVVDLTPPPVPSYESSDSVEDANAG